MQNKSSSPQLGPSLADFDESGGKNNGTADFFDLLGIRDNVQSSTTGTPSSWATFDCKTLFILDIF